MFLGKGVTLRGTVIIVCSDGQKIDIPNGSVLENVVITGNLQILEHWLFYKYENELNSHQD